MLAVAKRRADGTYLADAPGPPSADLVAVLARRAHGGAVLLGFDFPIGLPEAFAVPAGLGQFPEWLAGQAEAAWEQWCRPAALPAEIGRGRPYFPLCPGGASQAALAAAHGVLAYRDLLRRCDHATPQRPAACCMFWTLGAKQCGQAALAGWHEVLRPGLRTGATMAIWPFAGKLSDLLAEGGCIVAETYPAEFYAELGPRRRFSKRRQTDRQCLAGGIFGAANRAGLVAEVGLAVAIEDGFGPRPDGENAFDAVIGLIGMLLVLRGLRPSEPPDAAAVHRHEGWMLGLDPRTPRS